MIPKPHLTNLTSQASILASITFIPIISQSIGLDKTYITLIVALYSLFVFLSSAIGGRLSDIFGRKLLIKFGLLASTITFILPMYSQDATTLLMARILAGISAGLAPPALMAYAYEQKYKMGYFSSYGAFGWGLGSIVAGWVAMFQIGYVFLTSGIFFFLSFLIALTLEEKYPQSDSKLDSYNKNTENVSSISVLIKNFPIYFPLFLRHSAAMAVWTLWPLFLKDILSFSTFEIGIVQATNAFTQFIIMGFFTDKLNSDFSFELGLIISGVTFLTFLSTNIFLLFLITQVLLGFSWANVFVGAVKQITEKNPNARGTASGFLTASISIAGLLGPMYTFLFLIYFPDPDIYYILIIFAALMSFLAFSTHFIYRKLSQKRMLLVRANI